MTVLRHEKPAEEYEVEIQKKSGKGAGLCFAAFWSNKGVYVKELVSLILSTYLAPSNVL
jgi:hypothetical protein